jgi:tellurite methyltransferase
VRRERPSGESEIPAGQVPREQISREQIPPGAREWEDSFREHEPGWFFGQEPSTLARRVAHFFRLMEVPTAGRLLDLGCGEGRDAVFFSTLGFEVEAMDGAPTGIERAQEWLARSGHAARVSWADIGSLDWEGDYDVIVANNSLQFAGSEALRVLEEIRAHTRPDGWNAIGMFTKEEFDWRREPHLYCLEPRELKHRYHDWTVLEYGESIVYSPRRARYISLANLIARRPAGA